MPPQEVFDDLLVQITETTISPSKPPVKMGKEPEMFQDGLGLIALRLELCDVSRNMRTQRAVVQASNRFELSE